VSKGENGYDLNTEAMQEILEAQKKRERVQELRKDLVGE
jgi:hypothetical protein